MKSKTGRRQSLTLTNLQTDRSKTQGKKQPMCFQDTCLFCPLIKVKVKFPQSCLTFCDPMDCIVFGIFRARILEWVAVPFSRGLSQPRDRTQVSSTSVDSLPSESTGKPCKSLCNFKKHFYFIYLDCAGSSLWCIGFSSCSVRVACGIQFPEQGSNLDPLHWEHRVLANVPPGKPLSLCNSKPHNLQ